MTPRSSPSAVGLPPEPASSPTSPATAAPAAAYAPTQPPTPAAFAPTPVAAKSAPPESTPSGSRPSRATPSKDHYTNPEFVVQEPTVGTRIHHYEIIRLLGRGGMGAVFLARDNRLGRRVAIKFLRTQSPELTKRFILEARTTAACSHENIVVIFEVDAWQGSPFMVFEYLQGKTLTKLIPEDKPLPPARAVELIVPVVRALAAAHSQGVVHRDLKPDNILVTEAGITKVLDFGIAKVLQDDEHAPNIVAEVQRPRPPKETLDDDATSAELTQKGAMMGTLSYMAPEQWGIGVPIDHRADIWAVGIMLFKMLSGKHPLDPLRGHQLMITGMLDTPMPKLAPKAPDHVPPDLAAVVDRCLLKRKEQRWPDAVSLLRALEPFLPGRYSTVELKIDESPYAGLAAFQESDAARFFGRTQEIVATVNRVRERPMIAVVGPSGAGKSSFVRAGLVPALKRSGEAWESMVLRPGRAPLAALASLVSPLVNTSSSVGEELNEQKKLAERLATEPGFVGAVLRARARREKKNILLFVDQFEELYTLVPDEAERKAFTASLSAVADDPTSPIRLVLSVRSDFLDRMPEDQRFMAEVSQGLVFLGAPGVDGLRDALVQPADIAGYKFESTEIVEDMIRHLSNTQGALPLLQFAAMRLWDSRDPARRLLTKASYDAIGGVAGALASHADAVVSKLPTSAQALARALFLRLITADRTRAIVSLDELKELHPNAAELKTVLDELVQARLLVVQTGGGGGAATVEIVHESLLHSWPMLKRWLDESGEDAAFLEQLRTAARQWGQKNRPDELLWRGELADEAARFQRRYKGPLPDLQKGFLDGVVALTKREARRKRTLTVGAVVFLSLLLAASMVALIVIRKAQFEAETQAVNAKLAEAAAKESLEAAEKKERERAAAQAEAEKAAGELRVKQQELVQALRDAEDAAEEARQAESKAQKNALAALTAKKASEDAKARADVARKKVQELLAAEQERARRLEDQLGSPVMDTLK
jgi:serine/threonine protein kinase/energy-coupling factor transporter ATP-binding protein EcfA2